MAECEEKRKEKILFFLINFAHLCALSLSLPTMFDGSGRSGESERRSHDTMLFNARTHHFLYQFNSFYFFQLLNCSR